MINNILIQCSPNKSHHLHVLSLAKYLNSRSDCNVRLLAMEGDDASLFKDFDVYFAKYNPFSSIESLLRWSKIKILNIKSQDFYLLSLSVKKIFEDSDVFICTDLIDGYKIKRINPNCKVIWGLHGPVASNFASDIINTSSSIDLILSPGETTTKAMKRSGNKIVEVGSLKLDSCKDINTFLNKGDVFNNNNITLLFNPHFNRNIGASLWNDFGIEILELISKKENINIIFSPHPMLSRELKENEDIYEKLEELSLCENIIIDLESNNTSNMAYDRIVDVYIGDISSHALEYMAIRERIFLFYNNRHSSNETKVMQQSGRVFNDIDKMISQIFVELTHEEILKQREYVNTVFKTVENPVEKSSHAILELLK
ncbi:TPA: hypothetical protein ACX6SR_003698 [Photobacterium damselae]